MREILFKAKRKDNGEWVEGYYCKISETTYAFAEDYEKHPIPVHHYILQESMTDWGLPNKFWQYEIDPETLCQYTGLKDKNGNRIWENDVVKDDNKLLLGTVIWLQDDYDYMGWFLDDENLVEPEMMKETMWRDCEVLGNLFDNPELLGGHDEQMA